MRKRFSVPRCGWLPAETETRPAVTAFIKANKGSFIGFVEPSSAFSFQYLSNDTLFKRVIGLQRSLKKAAQEQEHERADVLGPRSYAGPPAWGETRG